MEERGDERKLVLLTGATGFVGGLCREHWGGAGLYRLRLADVRPMVEAVDTSRTPGQGNAQLAAHEEFVQLDIADYAHFLAACQGVHTVVHLAATPGGPQDGYSSDSGKWGADEAGGFDDPKSFMNEYLPRNIVGMYNAYAAANEAGCQRVVVASSVQAVLGYSAEMHHDESVGGVGDWTSGHEQQHPHGQDSDRGIAWSAPVWPLNVYGATKCWAEALARVYSSSHGLSCLCVRLGGFGMGAKEVRVYTRTPQLPATVFTLPVTTMIRISLGLDAVLLKPVLSLCSTAGHLCWYLRCRCRAGVQRLRRRTAIAQIWHRAWAQ